MGVLRWAFAVVAASALGFGFAVLSGSVFLAAVSAALVLIVAAYLFRERHSAAGPSPGGRRTGASGAGYVATYGADAIDAGSSSGDCGPGGDAGGG